MSGKKGCLEKEKSKASIDKAVEKKRRKDATCTQQPRKKTMIACLEWEAAQRAGERVKNE